jgi:Tfp pilus assembly protein PilV
MNAARPGFSLLEVLFAMLFLSVGILAMGLSTVHVLRLVQHSALMTERDAAVQEVSEKLRATDWGALETTCSSSTFTVGRFTVTCTTTQPQNLLKKVQLVSVGPGYLAGESNGQVADTTALVMSKPVD